jgi:hypothetical protein
MKPREVSDEDLASLNELVQSGLAEVVMIADGEPFYRLASSFTVPAAPESCGEPEPSVVARRQ